MFYLENVLVKYLSLFAMVWSTMNL